MPPPQQTPEVQACCVPLRLQSWSQCGANYVIAGLYCRQTCGRCQPPSPSPSSASPSSPAPCADTPAPGGFTCQQQKGWSKCNDAILTQGNYCAATCGRCQQQSQQSQPPSSPPPSSSGSCTDTPAPGGFTCQQQKGWGKCYDAVLTQGNYCAATCGRCQQKQGSPPPVSPQPATPPAPSSSSSACTDYIPSGQPSCSTWASWPGTSGCGNSWIIQNNYCAQSCGRCGGGGGGSGGAASSATASSSSGGTSASASATSTSSGGGSSSHATASATASGSGR